VLFLNKSTSFYPAGTPGLPFNTNPMADDAKKKNESTSSTGILPVCIGRFSWDSAAEYRQNLSATT
jgi:hypothetical protein